MDAEKSIRKYQRHKWLNILAFGLLYSTMYIGRFNFNNALPEIEAEFGISGAVHSILYSSVFLAYAVGCLINGFLVDRFKAKKFIILGCVGTVLANFAMPLAGFWQALLLISLINGFMQSMVWIGGISILVHWFERSHRGLPVGIINMCSAFAYLLMLYFPQWVRLLPMDGWRTDLIYPMFMVCYFAVLFYALFRETPGDAALADYREEDTEAAKQEEVLESVPMKYFSVLKHFLRNRRLLCWAGIAFLSSFCRYGLLAWIPAFYANEGQLLFMGEETTNFTLSMGMAFGTLVVSWLAGKYYCKNKGVVVTVAASLCATLVVLFPNLSGSFTVIAAIFFTGFLLFGINGVLWLYAMDEGGRRFAGTVTGILNSAAYLGATLQPYIFSWLLSAVEDWMLVFLLVEIVCILMVVFGLLVCRRDTNIEKG